MRVESVTAFHLAAPFSGQYWGSRAWQGSSPEARYKWEPSDGLAYPPRWRMRNAYSDRLEVVLVRVEAEGVVGWGEAKAPVAGRATAAVIDDLLGDIVVGQSIFDRLRIWDQMYSSMRLRGHYSGFLLEAMSGIDIALVDAAAQAVGQPAYELLGGSFRDSVPLYASGIPALSSLTDTEEERVRETARSVVTDGFAATKIGLTGVLDRDISTIKLVRDTVGNDFEIYMDGGGTYDLIGARRLIEAVAGFEIGFFEAPMPPEHVDEYRLLRATSSIRLASDLLVQRFQTLDYLKRDALDIVQPDVCRSGGITETQRIGQLADAFGAGFAPHLSIGSPIQMAASAHVALATPNLVVCERPLLPGTLDDLVTLDLDEQDGSWTIGSSPGLGVQVDEERIEAFRVR